MTVWPTGGETEEEKIRVDMMENQIMDFRMQLIQLCYNADHVSFLSRKASRKRSIEEPKCYFCSIRMQMMTAILTFPFTSLPGKTEASVLGTATWTTETVLLVPGEILMVCRGKGRKKGKGGDPFLSLQVLMNSPDLMILSFL